VLLPKLFVQSTAHNLSLDRGRGREVGLSALATVVSDGYCESGCESALRSAVRCETLRHPAREEYASGRLDKWIV
jgi:hypothetical protein